MEKKKNAVDRIMEKYTERKDERIVNEILISFKTPNLERRINRSQRLMLVVESGVWKKHDNKYDRYLQ